MNEGVSITSLKSNWRLGSNRSTSMARIMVIVTRRMVAIVLEFPLSFPRTIKM
jgi:hypothetical protein